MRKRKKKIQRPELDAMLRKHGSYEKAARFLATNGVEVSSSYLYFLVRGERNPSHAMAHRLAQVLGLLVEEVEA